MKEGFLVFLVPVTLVAIAAARSGGGFAGVWSACRGEPLLFVVQLFVALCGVLLIALLISVAGALVRWILRRMKCTPDEPIRFGLAEGMIVGLAVVGLALGHSSKNIYYSPYDSSQVEFRRLSWIEDPLGFGGGSDCFALVSVTFQDNDGHVVEYRCSELKEDFPGDLWPERSIRWSTNGLSRAYVALATTQNYLFFPDDIDVGRESPPENAIVAYLHGEPVEAVNQMIRNEHSRNEPD